MVGVEKGDAVNRRAEVGGWYRDRSWALWRYVSQLNLDEVES